MAELCCIVAAVCDGWCSDEEEESIRKSMEIEMILQVASSLKKHVALLHGEKVSK